MRIDNELISMWMKDFETLPPKEVMNRAMKSFIHQRHKLHDKELVLDTFAASVYGVSVTQIRQSRAANAVDSPRSMPSTSHTKSIKNGRRNTSILQRFTDQTIFHTLLPSKAFVCYL